MVIEAQSVLSFRVNAITFGRLRLLGFSPHCTELRPLHHYQYAVDWDIDMLILNSSFTS